MAADAPSFSFLDRLRQRYLQRRMQGEGEDKPPQRGLVITVCMLLSCVLWFTFTMQEIYSVTMPLPTRVVDLDPEQALTELPPRQVDVTVQGEGYQLLQLYYDRPVLTLDASSGTVDLETAVTAELPNNVGLVSMRPRQVQLDKDLRIERKIPVRSRVEITTPPTHDFIEGPHVMPDSISVRGARSVVNGIRYWPTERVVRRDLKDSLEIEVPLLDTLGGLVQRVPQEVTVRAVAEQFTEGTRDIQVAVRGVPMEEELRLSPSVVRVTYRVPLTRFKEAEVAGDFYAEVSYQQIFDDTTGRVSPTLQLPPDLDIRDVRMLPSSLRYWHVMGAGNRTALRRP